MNAIEAQTHAQKMFAAHGPKALAEAAQKIRQFETAGNTAQVQDWRQIEAALRNLKSPMAS